MLWAAILVLIVSLTIVGVAQPQPATCEDNLAAFRALVETVSASRTQTELNLAATTARLRAVEKELADLKAKEKK